jgi:hypothetical protein
LAPTGLDVCAPALARIRHTRSGHHPVRPLLHPPSIVIHPALPRVAPPALLDLEAKRVEPHRPILPDGPRPLAEA